MEEDINDYLEENPYGDELSIDDLDDNIDRAEKFRTNYIKLYLQFERIAESNDEQNINYNRTLSRLKEFIGDGKKTKERCRRKKISWINHWQQPNFY